MTARRTAAILVVFGLSSPAAAQEVLGTITAFTGGEERTWYVTQTDEVSQSSWSEEDDTIRITLFGHSSPDTATDRDGGVELEFTVTGSAGNAEASDVRIVWYDDETTWVSGEGNRSEVSLTAFGVDQETVIATGGFSGAMNEEGTDPDDLGGATIEGDFQATVAPPLDG